MKAARKPQCKETVDGCAHAHQTFRKCSCLSTRYLKYIIIEIHRRIAQRYSGFVWFDLCICSYSVSGLFHFKPSLLLLSFVRFFVRVSHNCLKFEISLRQLLSTTSPPFTIYLIAQFQMNACRTEKMHELFAASNDFYSMYTSGGFSKSKVILMETDDSNNSQKYQKQQQQLTSE